jgi:hypothetical protein
MDVMFLRLLNDIAERSPVTLWTVGNLDTFSSLFRSTNEKMQSCSLEQVETAMGALCQVGIAYEKAKRVISAENKKPSSNEIEKALLAQFPEKSTSVETNSPPADLGKMYMPSMLNALVSFATPVPSHLDVLTSCMGHLSTCSLQCPSMLAGGESSLTFLMRSCMSIAQISSHDDEDITFLRLSALDVLATISGIPQIKRSILQPNGGSPKSIADLNRKSPLLQFLIQGNDVGSKQKGVLYICAELAVTGVDEDEESWANEPALIYDSESSWESDQTAIYAESLFESFVEILGGASTLPAAFQLVEILLATPSWQNQRAVLSMLERGLAAAPLTFVPHVPATVETAIRLVQSSSPRVQYQAVQLIGSLCCANSVEADSTPASGHHILVREKYGDKILESVSHLIKSSCTKVASNACLTIVSYCRGGNGSENCMIPIEKHLIVPFVSSLLEDLRAGPLSLDVYPPASISEGSLTVLIRAIGVVACLADASGEDFMPYYGVMRGLIACAMFGLEGSDQGLRVQANVRNSYEVTMLRGSAIEAATIVGQAVSGTEGGKRTRVTYAYIALLILQTNSPTVLFFCRKRSSLRSGCIRSYEHCNYTPERRQFGHHSNGSTSCSLCKNCGGYGCTLSSFSASCAPSYSQTSNGKA